MSVLVTGAAGFIGFYTAAALIERGEMVVGLDNLNEYYDVGLKRARLAKLNEHSNFVFYQANVENREAVDGIIEAHQDVDRIVHLAAQVGVRYSLENPFEYINSNVLGQITLLEAARRLKNFKHFVYASSSSIYGSNTGLPFSEHQRIDWPISVYAASKSS
ncbi:MAG: SDR family NAD(P)-dependent oxidoreductase, partial [Pseudomonadota bacterium]|nr:SDR family NAD(P)-dependent oxidoreductase [Pseudomonadota bacterium]